MPPPEQGSDFLKAGELLWDGTRSTAEKDRAHILSPAKKADVTNTQICVGFEQYLRILFPMNDLLVLGGLNLSVSAVEQSWHGEKQNQNDRI